MAMQKTKRKRRPNTRAKSEYSLRHPLADRNILLVEISPLRKPDSRAVDLRYKAETPWERKKRRQEIHQYLLAHNVPHSEIYYRLVDYRSPGAGIAIWVLIWPKSYRQLKSQANRKGYHVYIWPDSQAIPPLVRR